MVVLAGYADRMDTFFRSNPGMASRIAHHIGFPGYTVDELDQIAGLMTADLGYAFTAGARRVFREQLARRGSPTPAACATPSNGPDCGTPAG